MDGMFRGRPQSFRYQRRPVDDSGPGQGGMAQDGGTRGGTFYGEMDRCRESQGWTTACSSMPEQPQFREINNFFFLRTRIARF